MENCSPIALPKEYALDHGKPYPPLAVVDKIEYNRQERLRQQLRADDLVEQGQQRYDVELHLRGGIQEEVRYCRIIPQLWLPASNARATIDRRWSRLSTAGCA